MNIFYFCCYLINIKTYHTSFSYSTGSDQNMSKIKIIENSNLVVTSKNKSIIIFIRYYYIFIKIIISNFVMYCLVFIMGKKVV